MKKKLISLVILSGILSSTLFGYTISASAAPISTTNTVTSANNSVSSSISQIEDQLDKEDNDISNTLVEVNNQNKKMSSLEQEISTNDKNVKELSKNVDHLNSVSSARMRTMYINKSNETYLGVILSSKSLLDLINNASAVNRVLNFDKTTLQNLQKEKKDLKEKESKLSKDKAELLKLKDETSKKLSSLEAAKEKDKVLLDRLNKCTSEEEAAQVLNLSRCSFSSNNEVVNYAFNFLGIPYLWGGSSPDTGFDCSGFVMYVYAHFGVNLPRVSEDQQNFGVNVPSREDLKPGDLVFFGSPAHHVGMYIGDNKYIQAPHTGDVIKISELGNYTSAQRVK